MNYSKIQIRGFRGFGTVQTLNIAIPNRTKGSGLTIIVGPNNSGKSTMKCRFILAENCRF